MSSRSPPSPHFPGAAASSPRSSGWRSRLRCGSVRTVTTTCSTSSAPRAETERHPRPPEDQSASTTFYRPPHILQSSHVSDNHMHSIGFITTGIKQKWTETLWLLWPPALITQSWKERKEKHRLGAFQSITCHRKTLQTCLYCKYRPWPF